MNLGASRFTCFVADNDAVQTYLREKTDYESIAEMPDDEVDFAALPHHQRSEDGQREPDAETSLPTPTGDYLTAGGRCRDAAALYRQRRGQGAPFLVRRDIETTNGVIHTLDKLLEPPDRERLGDYLRNSRLFELLGRLRASGFDEWLDNTYRTINETTIPGEQDRAGRFRTRCSAAGASTVWTI